MRLFLNKKYERYSLSKVYYHIECYNNSLRSHCLYFDIRLKWVFFLSRTNIFLHMLNITYSRVPNECANISRSPSEKPRPCTKDVANFFKGFLHFRWRRYRHVKEEVAPVANPLAILKQNIGSCLVKAIFYSF